jgi:hypothetical protein
MKPRSWANNVKERRRGLKRWLEANEQEEVTNKFVTNMPKLLLEVSFSQFHFFAYCLKFPFNAYYMPVSILKRF